MPYNSQRKLNWCGPEGVLTRHVFYRFD